MGKRNDTSKDTVHRHMRQQKVHARVSLAYLADLYLLKANSRCTLRHTVKVPSLASITSCGLQRLWRSPLEELPDSAQVLHVLQTADSPICDPQDLASAAKPHRAGQQLPQKQQPHSPTSALLSATIQILAPQCFQEAAIPRNSLGTCRRSAVEGTSLTQLPHQ